MKIGSVPRVAVVAVTLVVLGGVAFAAQDRYSLKIPDGLALADFKGYDGWQAVATSATENSIKVILANPTMIAAYKSGIPGNGKPFPEGSKVAKIEWAKVKNPESPYFVEVPGDLKTLAFIEKDSKRFPDTHGWAYAQWAYDPKSDTLKPNAPLSATGHTCGYACHSVVAKKDYIFTAYPKR
ncbi:MAG TPA: cytochrome P460 family protein [Rhizomicrobium sp.]|nr:cytochrome P460 family protein [Rhizomicrobium sp.]